mmetsp:Transcript_10381/g.32167  ORF Transcript_10381/g.32167 Transcript_10381/m.32167 type:complete len:228 (+) Transcript_10381:371-1054(+)
MLVIRSSSPRRSVAARTPPNHTKTGCTTRTGNSSSRRRQPHGVLASPTSAALRSRASLRSAAGRLACIVKCSAAAFPNRRRCTPRRLTWHGLLLRQRISRPRAMRSPRCRRHCRHPSSTGACPRVSGATAPGTQTSDARRADPSRTVAPSTKSLTGKTGTRSSASRCARRPRHCGWRWGSSRRRRWTPAPRTCSPCWRRVQKRRAGHRQRRSTLCGSTRQVCSRSTT